MNTTPLFMILAGLLALLTILISLKVLKGNPILGNPVISIIVGIIGFMALRNCVADALPAIMLPYAVLLLCLPLVLFLMLFFGKGSRWSDGESRREHERHKECQPGESFRNPENIHDDNETND